MNISDLKGKKITVMGLGLHGGGIGAVRFLSSLGARIIVTDMKSKEELNSSVEKLKDCKGVTYVFSQHRPEDFTKVDMVIKNPAVSWNNKYVKMALDKKIPVEMDSSLFFKLCHSPIIGVTGTKGKTTTTSLIYSMLKTAGKDVIKVGVGQTSVLDRLIKLKKNTWVVFELSSWRLSGLGKYKLSPHIAVVTNLYPDHLNYYKSMEEYMRDKKYIFLNQSGKDYCILNYDDGILKGWEEELKSKVIKYARHRPERGESVYLEGGKIFLDNGLDKKEIVNVSEISLRGEHNVCNVMAAFGAVYAAGLDLQLAKKALLEFKGVAHRLELVREFKSVKYYNDTAATTPESAVSGLRSFIDPVILISGGTDKNLDMKKLAEEILKRAKEVIFLRGTATDKLLLEMEKIGSGAGNFPVVGSMETAVSLARAKSKPGDVVLLSPGAASFGLFLNEFDRGDKFKEAVKKLK